MVDDVMGLPLAQKGTEQEECQDGEIDKRGHPSRWRAVVDDYEAPSASRPEDLVEDAGRSSDGTNRSDVSCNPTALAERLGRSGS